jgi:hypothetical protein
MRCLAPQIPLAEATANSKKLKPAKQAEEMKQVDQMRKALNTMKDKGCTLCYASGNSGGRSHKLSQCPSWENMRFSLGKYFDRKKAIRYNNHKGICWKCHVPTCSDELHLPLAKGKGDEQCNWPDIVVPLALTIFEFDDLKEAAEKYFAVEWVTLDAFTKWLMKAPASGHHSKGMDPLLWYVEIHRKDT